MQYVNLVELLVSADMILNTSTPVKLVPLLKDVFNVKLLINVPFVKKDIG